MSFANVGSLDRILRIAIGAAIFVYVFLAGTIAPASPMGIGAMIVGGILIATAFINFCPLYAILRIRTRAKS